MSVNSILYSNGVASMLGQKLFTTDKFVRLAESGNLSSAVKILYETGYGGGTTIASPTDYPKILDAEMDTLIDFFKYHCVDRRALECFLKGYDYLNCKLLYKAYRQEKQLINLCNHYGQIPPETIEECLQTGNYTSLPAQMSSAIDTLNTMYADKINPAIIDSVFDRAMYQDILSTAIQCTSPLIAKYFKLKVDFVNIMCSFRCAKAGYAADKYAEMIIDCGNLSVEKLIACYDVNVDVIVERYRQSLLSVDQSGMDYELRYYLEKDHLDLCILCAQAVADRVSFVSAEVFAFNKCKDILVDYKSQLNTILPLITYYLSKTTEIDNVKMVLTCVANNVDSALIKSRLKELYV